MAGKKILIAEDDLAMRSAIKLRMEAEGFEVIVAQDAYQATDFARRYAPDLLLLDINMPAGSGLSVADRMASINDLKGIPVIFVTGSTDAEAVRDAKRSGAFAVLRKPFVPAELICLVHDALAEHDVHAER